METRILSFMVLLATTFLITLFTYKEPWKYKVGDCIKDGSNYYKIEDIQLDYNKYTIRWIWFDLERYSSTLSSLSKSSVQINTNTIQCPIFNKEK